jgi:hypothetical protein
MDYTTILSTMGTALSNLAVKQTVYSINSKISTMKNEYDVNTVRKQYNEMIDELISERGEAIRIAQVYKNEIDRIQINDEDIEHLQNTVSRIIDVFKERDPEKPMDTFVQLKELINADTLKTMQLLGFNFKTAIGEPLTELCANSISSLKKSTVSQVENELNPQANTKKNKR